MAQNKNESLIRIIGRRFFPNIFLGRKEYTLVILFKQTKHERKRKCQKFRQAQFFP